MLKKGAWLLGVLLSAVLTFPADHYRVAGESGEFYFGHISFVEAKAEGIGPTIQREGSVLSEPATLNTPVGPGDIIRTTYARRCEIQFDSGTIVRLDTDTELKVETILAESLSADTGLSNLVLGAGRIYVMFKEYDEREIFQVLTSNAAVKLKHGAVAVIEAAGDGPTEVRVKTGKASVLYGAEAERARARTVKKLGRLVVLADGRFEESGYPPDTAFETWNAEMNANFIPLHKGLSPLPKPLRTLPRAVFDFAQRFGNTNGEWLWDDLFGYVWRPFLNDQRYPWGNWSPYIYGRWAEAGDSMFWVPEEPWGWIPYHLGLWQWDRKLGWVWLPGSLFAPAWAAWDFFEGYYAWRPWTLLDWYFQGRSLSYAYAYGFDGMYGRWPYYGPGHFGPQPPEKAATPLTQVRKDQLKMPSHAAVPKELKKAYVNVVAALGRKDSRIIEALRGTLDRSAFVAHGDLNSRRLQDKVLTWDKVRAAASERIAVPEAPPAFPRVDALLTYRQNTGVVRPLPDAAPLVGPIPAGAARFRDWNPDIGLARALGVRIDYSSRTNEILCRELKISSRDLGRRGLRLSSWGLVRDFSRGTSSGSGSSGSVSSVQVSSQTGYGRSAQPAGGKTEGGTTKKD
jgi:hypothetical protein